MNDNSDKSVPFPVIILAEATFDQINTLTHYRHEFPIDFFSKQNTQSLDKFYVASILNASRPPCHMIGGILFRTRYDTNSLPRHDVLHSYLAEMVGQLKHVSECAKRMKRIKLFPMITSIPLDSVPNDSTIIQIFGDIWLRSVEEGTA